MPVFVLGQQFQICQLTVQPFFQYHAHKSVRWSEYCCDRALPARLSHRHRIRLKWLRAYALKNGNQRRVAILCESPLNSI